MSSYGLVGLGAIGQNLALNIQKKTDVHVYNRTPQKVNELMKRGLGIRGHESLCEMISSMELPRTIITTLPSGETTDSVIRHMLKSLDPLDTVIDCSNEHYRVSRHRGAYLATHGIRYIGAGLSGGAKGALNGQLSCLVVINLPTTIIENFLRLSVKMLHTWVMILGLVITQRWFIMG